MLKCTFMRGESINFSDMFKRDCRDCIHFNPKRLKDEDEHYCLLGNKCTASLGCPEYKSEYGLFKNYRIKEIGGLKPVMFYNGSSNAFFSIEELHQWKIEHMWNGIDIAVTEEDILR